MDKIDNMLLRIRAETLRLNLKQASDTLENLPTLSEELEDARRILDKTSESAGKLAECLSDLGISALKGNPPSHVELREPRNAAEDIGSGLKKMDAGLQEIRNNSFIAQVASGKDIATNIGSVASDLIVTVEAIERDIADPAQFSAAWQRLSTAWEEAGGQVFSESIELLGGIALRDARLDDNICELADALIATISRYNRPPTRAIPGGIASIMMTSDRVIRLPFPQWTIWALPLTAHELYHIILQKELGRRAEITRATAGVVALLGGPAADRCLADVFATYTLGPAYAYAAITQLFDPTRQEDEARMEAILTTLALMNPTHDVGPGSSYLTEAEWLRSEWEAAKRWCIAAAWARYEIGSP